MGQRAIVWFDEITKEDISLAGGKGANLGEMTRAKIPVPPGFVVTSQAYFDVLEKNDMVERIREALKPLDPHDSQQLQEIAAEIENLIMSMPMPRGLADEIEQAYLKMGSGFVAVRSSATAEDLPEASFAGQQSTYLNVRGPKEVVHAVQKCWASLFNSRAIFYRQENGFDHFKVGIAVPVQRMVQSDVSGVMFTVDPTNSDRSKILIEAIMGLGEMIVSGDVTPDHYIVDKDSFRIVEKQIKPQEWKLVRNERAHAQEPNIKIILTPDEKAAQKISDEDILELARIGWRLENHYKFPQDVEWAKENGNLFVVQTRPITTLRESQEPADLGPKIEASVLLSGAPIF